MSRCATDLIRDHDMKSDSIEDSNTLPNCVARMSIETKFFSVLDVINSERSSCVHGVSVFGMMKVMPCLIRMFVMMCK